MARLLWLPAALREEGVTVVEHDGWMTRGRDGMAPGGIVCHHTAGPAKGDAPSLNVCIHGRSDLPGPLCHIVLARSGVAHVIASGVANHAGRGGWNGLSGNATVVGIEGENTGRGEVWSEQQLDAFARCCAAVCRRLHLSVEMVCGHKEWAPGRKPDPTGIDMPSFRARVSGLLNDTPEPAPQEDVMLLIEVTDGPDKGKVFFDHAGVLRPQTDASAGHLAAGGVRRQKMDSEAWAQVKATAKGA